MGGGQSKPAGKVEANDEKFKGIVGFPTNRELASTVHELPEPVQGHLLADELPPISESGQLCQFSITKGRFTLLNRKDTFSVLDADEQAFQDGLHITEQATILGLNKITVKDKDEKPLILACQEPKRINKAYFIYSKTPLFDGDTAAETENGVPFFPMFKVRDIDDSHLDYRSILVWNGKNYQPMLHVKASRRRPEMDTGAPMTIRNNLLIVDKKDDNKVYGIMVKKSLEERRTERLAGWDAVVAPGTDVGMMIILAAVMDDMVGWFA